MGWRLGGSDMFWSGQETGTPEDLSTALYHAAQGVSDPSMGVTGSDLNQKITKYGCSDLPFYQ